MNEKRQLSNAQVVDLARPLVGIITKFYEDPENEEEFQKWLMNLENQKVTSNAE